MNILVCVKRVPVTGGRIILTDDGRAIDARFLGFTISPHEECGVEEAVRIVEAQGGSSAVLTLGPDAATEQLRDALAVGIERAILLEIGAGEEWDAVATAAAIVDAVRAQEAAATPFDLIFFGTEAADTGDYQVGIRVATALDRPIVSGVKHLAVEGGRMTARREATGGGWEVYEVPLPAIVSVREGLNLPRYPSVPGRLRAKRQPIERISPMRPAPTRAAGSGSLTMERLRLPVEQERSAEILGHGPDAAPKVVEILRRLGAV